MTNILSNISVVKLGQLGRVLGRVLGLGFLLRRVKPTRPNYSEIGQTRIKLGQTRVKIDLTRSKSVQLGQTRQKTVKLKVLIF